jgi:protein involved in polysaccharide export with SLBB domain
VATAAVAVETVEDVTAVDLVAIVGAVKHPVMVVLSPVNLRVKVAVTIAAVVSTVLPAPVAVIVVGF